MHNSAVLMREELGEVLREARQQKRLTLRGLSSDANIALSYLSEVERGQKEASSEVLLSITSALGVPLSDILLKVSDRLAVFEELSDVLGNESAENHCTTPI